ncbi:MAG: hypothetical protein R3362_04330 [Rhodothermales bacterium]|nr:hypothetical protein [Rhodothermales bacterium]
MRRLSFLLPLLFLTACWAACGGEPEPLPDPSAAEAPGRTAPEGADEQPGAAPVPADPGRDNGSRTVRDSGEVIRLDLAHVLTATLPNATVGNVQSGGGMELLVGDDVEAVDEAAVRAWLRRYAPLEADGRYAGLDARELYNDPDQRVSFAFDDGSSRTVAFTRRGDSLAVVSQLDGPVFRLPARRLPELVPDPATLRADS